MWEGVRIYDTLGVYNNFPGLSYLDGWLVEQDNSYLLGPKERHYSWLADWDLKLLNYVITITIWDVKVNRVKRL